MRRFALILSLVASFPLVAADAKVKTLLVATDRSLDALLPLIKQYEKTAKIKVVMETHGKELFTWLQEHPRKADLVVSADVLTLEKAKRSGLLYPLHSQLIDSNVITTYREKRNLYVGLSTHTRAIFYSKKRVKPEQLSTYNDLADIKWRGRICLGSGYGEENLILFTQIAADDGFGRIKDFLQGLKANLARTPGGDDREQIHAIAAGCSCLS